MGNEANGAGRAGAAGETGEISGAGKKADYHIHTWFSDGKASPADIVKQAKQLGYEEIAITDHDGMDGISEALVAGKDAGLRVIPGVELATETGDGLELHMLGYGLDKENLELHRVLEDLRQKREDRNRRLLNKLGEMGYPLSSEDLRQHSHHSYIGKPVIARAMEAKGYICHFKDAFAPGKFLESPELKAVKKEKIQAEQAIGLIVQAGGTAVLAHPIQIDGIGEKGSEAFYANLEKLIQRLKAEGLGGIECYHPDHSAENAARFVGLAQKYNLKITRGSDFHGEIFE